MKSLKSIIITGAISLTCATAGATMYLSQRDNMDYMMDFPGIQREQTLREKIAEFSDPGYRAYTDWLRGELAVQIENNKEAREKIGNERLWGLLGFSLLVLGVSGIVYCRQKLSTDEGELPVVRRIPNLEP